MSIISENQNVFVRHALLLKDGSWATWNLSDPNSEQIHWWDEKWKGVMFQESHPYFYFDKYKQTSGLPSYKKDKRVGCPASRAR